MIRSAAALRNDYDGMVKLSTEKQEPIYLTRNGDGEMVFLPIELWENVRQNWSSLRKCCAGSKINSPAQEHIPQANCVPTWRTFFARVEWLNKVHEFLAFLKYYKPKSVRLTRKSLRIKSFMLRSSLQSFWSWAYSNTIC